MCSGESHRVRPEGSVTGVTDVFRRKTYRNIHLRRGSGKTTRLLSIADYMRAPIICPTESHRRHIHSECKRWGFSVPAVYTAADIADGRLIGTSRSDYLVDDADDVLRCLLDRLSGGKVQVVAVSSTDDREVNEFE